MLQLGADDTTLHHRQSGVSMWQQLKLSLELSAASDKSRQLTAAVSA